MPGTDFFNVIFLQKLQEHGVKVEFNIMPGLDHFSIVENLNSKEYSLTNKITDLLFK